MYRKGRQKDWAEGEVKLCEHQKPHPNPQRALKPEHLYS